MTTKTVTIPESSTEITFDKELLEEFKVEYNKAVKDSQLMFVFYDKYFIIGYAKYLIEYLEPLLK